MPPLANGGLDLFRHGTHTPQRKRSDPPDIWPRVQLEQRPILPYGPLHGTRLLPLAIGRESRVPGSPRPKPPAHDLATNMQSLASNALQGYSDPILTLC